MAINYTPNPNAKGFSILDYNNYLNSIPQTQSSTPAQSSSQPASPVNVYANTGNAPLQQAQPFNPPDFNALIAPAIEGYNNYISTLQGQLPDTLSSIDKSLANQTDTINSSVKQQQQTVDTAKQAQQASQENAANEAKRIYSEIQQGLQSRYGGTTGTGAFATEIAGGQTARDVSNIRTTGAQLIKQLDDKSLQIQEVGRLALQDAQQSAEQQKLDAKNKLEQQIADIRSKIGETQANKATLYANAYQNYQDYVRQVDASNTAFQQNLYQQQLATQQQIENAKTHLSSIAATATPEDLKSLISQGFSISNAPVKTSSGAKVDVSASPSSGQGKLTTVYQNGLPQTGIQQSDGTIVDLNGNILYDPNNTGGGSSSLPSGL